MQDNITIKNDNNPLVNDKTIMRWNITLLAMFAFQVIGIYSIIWRFNLWDSFNPEINPEIFLACVGFVVFVKAASYFSTRYSDVKKPMPRDSILVDFKRVWLNKNYILSFLIPVLLLPNFIALFSAFKSHIPIIMPFYGDELFRDIDMALHFGVDPWRITHFIFGNQYFTLLIDFFYTLWFPIVFTYTVWQIVHVGFGFNRVRYLISFGLVWFINGSILALLFSSVGPVYFAEFLNGAQYFQPLMDQLHKIDAQLNASIGYGIANLQVQELLLNLFKYSKGGIGEGISAMPSLHVSVALLLFLAARRENKYIGYFKLIMLVFIIIGSVHLGWHYAVDAYLGLFATYIIWVSVGWFLHKVEK